MVKEKKGQSSYRTSNHSYTGRTQRDSLMSADNSYVNTYRPNYKSIIPNKNRMAMFRPEKEEQYDTSARTQNAEAIKMY